MGRKEELLTLLTKSVWTTQDILVYDNTLNSRQSATNVKTRAVNEFNGAVPYGKKFVLADSVLALYGTTREREIERLKKM